MKARTTALAALTAALVTGAPVLAQNAAPMMGTAVGEVRRIDLDASKLTVAHEPIEAFNMRAMTMVLQAPDRALIEKLAVGDKVRFTVTRNGPTFTLQAIEVVK